MGKRIPCLLNIKVCVSKLNQKRSYVLYFVYEHMGITSKGLLCVVFI